MKRHQVKWQVGLSNGETFFEGKGNFDYIDGAPSPWLRLFDYLAEKKCRITSLSLFTDTGQRWNLPSAGNRPKFKAFYEAEVPVDFNCFRKLGEDKKGIREGNELTVTETVSQDLFTVAQAEFENYFLEVWVNEANTKHAWTLILPKCQQN